MAIALTPTLRRPESARLPAKWVAATLALALSPALAFLYLQERRCALRYLLMNGLVLSLGGLFAFVGYEQFTLGVVLFCNFALVGVPGAAHVNTYSLESRKYGKRPLCATLPFVLSLPVVIAMSLYALTIWLNVKHMENTAMVPTLPQGAPYILDKVSFHWRAPRRGDIIEFTSRSALGEVTRISRIIGLPGDRIAMRSGLPVLNGTALPREAQGDIDLKDGISIVPAASFVEILPESTVYSVIKSEAAGTGPFDHRPEVAVLPESYFVLGDNRDVARDSRDQIQVGLVRQADILGNVIPLRLTEEEEARAARSLDWLLGLVGLSKDNSNPA